ncbi:DUF3310 domain-containing protein [Staphylococcus gallinarum]|uniref:DUF3310 domain-containing protein n=1 Tax=Staphylococcus gallinarum TaxID=1293 RepID=A0ABQ0Y2B6_STAGA|nr:DUF3310 domain-containing protein [Staphylococcus gallinarum]GEQ05540.1 hypothetical protein SGA02_13680 [Staphylococcus gallinarum]
MKIRDLNKGEYIIVYDLGKSEHSGGITVVGKVIELEFDDDDKNKAVIDSVGNLYTVTDENYFDNWQDHMESITESVSGEERLSATTKVILNDQKKSNDVQQPKRNDTVNHPSHYNYGDIEVIDFIEQVTQHYNANVAYHIGNAIKYLARSPYKNGKEDIAKAKWYIERAFENWDVK